MYATIYHPRFEPDESWLRAMLLFYDTVHSIVPDGAGYKSSPGVARLREKAPGAFVPLPPEIEDRAVLSAEKGIWKRYYAVTEFLDELGKESTAAERVSAPFYAERGVVHLTLDQAVAVHYDKLGQDFIDQLKARNLALEVEAPINPVAPSPTARWLYMDKRIASLCLSLLAERMRQRRGTINHTSSDEALCFGVAAKSEMNFRDEDWEKWSGEARLAAAIVKAHVPDELGQLPVDEYLEIRKRYAEYRDTFHLAVAEIEKLHLNHDFASRGELEAAMQRQLDAFAAGIQKIKARTEARRFRKWSAITLQRIVPVARAVAAIFTLC